MLRKRRKRERERERERERKGRRERYSFKFAVFCPENFVTIVFTIRFSINFNKLFFFKIYTSDTSSFYY